MSNLKTKIETQIKNKLSKTNSKTNANNPTKKLEASSNQPLDTEHLASFKSVVQQRRSVRRFTDREIPKETLNDCLDMALLAPSSSNLQPWQFIVIDSADMRKKASKICMNQNAAKTANKIIVCIARTDTWKPHMKDVLTEFPIQPVPKVVKNYYTRVAPLEFTLGPMNALAPLKWAMVKANRATGNATPAMRYNQDGVKIWAITSASLAVQNLMLAIKAHGFDSCPMGGFDEPAMKELLGLGKHQHVIMVLGAGERASDGIYHDQFRFERERFVSWV